MLLIFLFLFSIFPEHDFSIYSASNIAAASIAASLSGLNWHVKSRISIYDLVDKLAELSDSESVIRFIFKFMFEYILYVKNFSQKIQKNVL